MHRRLATAPAAAHCWPAVAVALAVPAACHCCRRGAAAAAPAEQRLVALLAAAAAAVLPRKGLTAPAGQAGSACVAGGGEPGRGNGKTVSKSTPRLPQRTTARNSNPCACSGHHITPMCMTVQRTHQHRAAAHLVKPRLHVVGTHLDRGGIWWCSASRPCLQLGGHQHLQVYVAAAGASSCFCAGAAASCCDGCRGIKHLWCVKAVRLQDPAGSGKHPGLREGRGHGECSRPFVCASLSHASLLRTLTALPAGSNKSTHLDSSSLRSDMLRVSQPAQARSRKQSGPNDTTHTPPGRSTRAACV